MVVRKQPFDDDFVEACRKLRLEDARVSADINELLDLFRDAVE